MHTRRFLLTLLAAVAIAGPGPSGVSAQEPGYPVTVIPIAKGPFTFPPGYTTPWEKIEIRVTEKMSSNLFVLHGSQGLDTAHPDASGGRAMALFGPDGVLMVDTQNRQVGDKTLQAIRSFTNAPIKAVVNTHIHGDHTGANAFFAKQGALIFSQENLRLEMVRPPPRADGQTAPAPDMAAVLRMAEGRCSFRHRVARSYGWRRCRVRNRIASLRHDRGIREGPATAPPLDSGTAQGGRSLDHRA